MIEQIKKDREEGTRGPWGVNPYRAQIDAQMVGLFGELLPVCQLLWPTEERSEDETAVNAVRIARLPELEEYVLEAHELLKEVLAGACVNYAYIAPRNIERIKKLVGEV